MSTTTTTTLESRRFLVRWGNSVRSEITKVTLTEQRGVFYAEGPRGLFPSSIAWGDTPDEAFAAWAKKMYNAQELES